MSAAIRSSIASGSRFLPPIAAALIGLAFLADEPRAAPADGPDSLGFRFEVGASSDYTNELFYEDTFDSTALTGRRLVDSPQTRYAGVMLARLAGTRGRRSTGFELQNELSLGDLLSRDALSFTLRSQPGSRWSIYATPHVEYRRDRTFGRDLEEWRGTAGVRARRELREATFAELGARGDLLRASGVGSEYVLDRQSGTVAFAFEQAPLWGLQWRLEYDLTGRVFADSSVRDHYEHAADAQLRIDLPGGRPLLVEAGADRRTTIALAPTSRDNFWEQRGALEGEIGLADSWSLKGRIEGQAIQYDIQDTSLYFNYQELKARLFPRFTRGTLSVAAGPRLDALFARLDPGEGYQELAAVVELESLALGAWWNVTPVAGWRDYDEAPGETQGIGIHSSYAFYEINVIADQALPGALKLRAFANARYESHVDAAQDARSLYFSLDLRRLF